MVVVFYREDWVGGGGGGISVMFVVDMGVLISY